MNTKNKTISIIDEIIGRDNYEHCIILTYNSSLSFYENIILKKLVASGCYHNVIMMDGAQYEDVINEEANDIQFCGKYYSLDPIRTAGAFHPKIILLTNKTGGKLLIGSGNATFPGYGNNHELFYKFEYSEDKDEHLPLFQKAKEFIVELAKHNYLNPATQKRINTIFEETDWIQGEVGESSDLLFHNMYTPLLNQITGQLPQNIKEIVLMAPYFDSKLAVIDKLKQLYSDAKIRIVTQDNNSNFPIQYFIDNQDKFQQVTLHKFKAEDSFRRLHAKMLYFSNDTHEYMFSGSANISAPALIRTAKKGNVESGVLIRSEKKEGPRLSAIWDDYFTKEKVISKNEINVWDISTSYKALVPKKIIQVKGAYVKDSVLYIDYSSESAGRVDIIINEHKAVQESISYGDNKIECLLNLSIKEKFNKGANIIYLKTGNGNSNRVWLHNYIIYKPGVENKITGFLGSLGNYVVDIEIAKSIIELTTTFEIKQGYENDIFKGSKLGDQEESGEQTELPEQRYFVEEKPDYQDMSVALTGVIEDDKYDIFSQLFGGVARQLHDYHERSIITERDVSNKKNSRDSEDKELQIKDVKNKLNSVVTRIVDRTVTQIYKKDTVLDLSAVMAINQLAASLTWFQNGIKIEYKNDQTSVAMARGDYVGNVLSLLHRLWSNINDDDFLGASLKADDYKLVSLVNITALPLCLLLYVAYLMKNDKSSFNVIENNYKKIADIYLGLNNFMSKVPDNLLSTVVSDEKIMKVYDQLFSFINGFRLPNLSWESLMKELVDRSELRGALQCLALRYKKNVQQKLEEELSDIEETSKKLNQELIEIQKVSSSQGGILDMLIGEQKMDKLAEEESNAKKIVETKINIDNMNECQLPVNTKKYFGL